MHAWKVYNRSRFAFRNFTERIAAILACAYVFTTTCGFDVLRRIKHNNITHNQLRIIVYYSNNYYRSRCVHTHCVRTKFVNNKRAKFGCARCCSSAKPRIAAPPPRSKLVWETIFFIFFKIHGTHRAIHIRIHTHTHAPPFGRRTRRVIIGRDTRESRIIGMISPSVMTDVPF